VGEKPLLINSLQTRRELLMKQGIDALLEIAFDQKMSQLEPEDFFQVWLVDGLYAKELIIGYDFKYGKQGRGDFDLLQQLGVLYSVKIEQIPPVQENAEVISSSRIRQLLLSGDLEQANKMLGYSFMIEGRVAHGEKRGRGLGFPTLNIHRDPDYILPCYGVYLVRVSAMGQIFFGLANVGIKPTFGEYTPRAEVYLFDVVINLYDEAVKVEFLKFIRKEIHFSGTAALISQVEQDIRSAKDLLRDFT
jgi:riboflavin kinase / FMN adenylyltransferase